MTPTEYRRKSEAPTEEGWYWGRMTYVHKDRNSRVQIQPYLLKISTVTDDLWAMRAGTSGRFSIDLIEWFGPVIAVLEG